MAPLTEPQWAVVRATLPPGADEAEFRSELERIANDTVPPKKRQQIHLKRAQIVDISNAKTATRETDRHSVGSGSIPRGLAGRRRSAGAVINRNHSAGIGP